MDPLSDVLSLLNPKSSISVGLEAGGAWSMSFGPPDGIKFNTITKGSCWLQVKGDPVNYRLETGDCFLLSQPRPFVLTSDLGLQPIDAGIVYEKAKNGIATCNDGGDFFLIGGRFAFESGHSDFLFGSLPATVHVPKAAAQASVLRWSLEQLALEMEYEKPGGVLFYEHLAQIMLLHVLRHLVESDDVKSGWLAALGDPKIAPVIAAIHNQPAKRWTLAELASLSAMSRTAFVNRFRDKLGVPPGAYLVNWRMLLACSQLRRPDITVSEVASLVGYKSESAFSAAFKKLMLCPPSQYAATSRSTN